MARKSRSKAKAAVTISNENGSNKQQSSVKREREGSDLKIAKKQGEKPTVKKKKSTGIPVRRSSRRKCNVLLSTRHLSRFHQLFWNTDRRNEKHKSSSEGEISDASGDKNGGRGRRKRPKGKSEDSSSSDKTPPEQQQFGRLVLQKVHDSPHIYMVDNFLTEADLVRCEQVIQKSSFKKSFVDNPETNDRLVDTDHRTSTFVSLPKQADSKVAAMERKSADLLGISIGQMEPLQLVRYRQDQFFGVHHDLGIFNDDDASVELPAKQTFCKRRLATIFCYLNDVSDGGCTYFPACKDLRVQPKRGRAVLFCNILENGDADPLTIHAGEPVRGKGNVKYGLNIWGCEE